MVNKEGVEEVPVLYEEFSTGEYTSSYDSYPPYHVSIDAAKKSK